MNSGVVLGTSAALCWGVVDVAIALLARRAPFVTVAVVVQGASVVMLAALAVVLGDFPELSGDQWVAVAALGPLGTGAYLAFYRALQLGPIAIVSPIASANGAVVVVLAVILLGDALPAPRPWAPLSCSAASCSLPWTWASGCRRVRPTATA